MICALVPRAMTTPIWSKLPVLVIPVAVTARFAAARVLPCTSTVAFWPLARLVSLPARKSWTGARTGADWAGVVAAGTMVAATTTAAASKRTGLRMGDLPRRMCERLLLNGEEPPQVTVPVREIDQTCPRSAVHWGSRRPDRHPDRAGWRPPRPPP